MLGWNMTIEEYRAYFSDPQNENYRLYCKNFYPQDASRNGDQGKMHIAMALLLNGVGSDPVQALYMDEITGISRTSTGALNEGAWKNTMSRFLGAKETAEFKEAPKLFHPEKKAVRMGMKISDAYREFLDSVEKSDIFSLTEENQTALKKLLQDLLTPPIKEQVMDRINRGGCRQIIFTGAPGTGKTFIAKEIAKAACTAKNPWGGQLTNPKTKQQECYTMVQFHPSYDYTDFVEGLRPISDAGQTNNQIPFAKVDGSFKAFCRKVVQANQDTAETYEKDLLRDLAAFRKLSADEKAFLKGRQKVAEFIGKLTRCLQDQDAKPLAAALSGSLDVLAQKETARKFCDELSRCKEALSSETLAGYLSTAETLSWELASVEASANFGESLTQTLKTLQSQNTLSALQKKLAANQLDDALTVMEDCSESIPDEIASSLKPILAKLSALRELEKIENALSGNQKFKKVETKKLADNAKRYIRTVEKEKYWASCDELCKKIGAAKPNDDTTEIKALTTQLIQMMNQDALDIGPAQTAIQNYLAAHEKTSVETLRAAAADRKPLISDSETLKEIGGILEQLSAVLNSEKPFADPEKVPYPLYFFIIDEINRANLSKVFGELMYCLEKDKRGAEHAIQTQYQNLDTYDVDKKAYLVKQDFKLEPEQKKELLDCFQGGFYIPKNVVVIGTMNDIDRSVDSMDFALRRRFEWKEFVVEPGMLISALKSGNYDDVISASAEKLAACIQNLNRYLEKNGKDYGINRQYFISQGQFANLPEDLNTPEEVLKYVWEYRIESLLREYLRGEDEEKIEEFVGSYEEMTGACKALFSPLTDDTGTKDKDDDETDETSGTTPPDGTGADQN